MYGVDGQASYSPRGSSSGFSDSTGGFSSINGGFSGSNGGSGSFGAGSGNSFSSAPRPGGFGGSSANAFGSSQSGSESESSGSLEDAVPGVPGDDYPIFSEVPETSFLCDGQVEGGYYADVDTDCQAFHICASDGKGGLTKYSFLCPNGTLFNQEYFVCDWWFNVDCSLAEDLYSRNEEIAAEREAITSSQRTGNQGGNQRGTQRGNQNSRNQSNQGSRTSSTIGRTASGSRGSVTGSQPRGTAGVRRASQGSASATYTQSFSGGQGQGQGLAGGQGGFQAADAGYGAPAGGFGNFSSSGNLGNYARNTRDLDNQLVEDVSEETVEEKVEEY